MHIFLRHPWEAWSMYQCWVQLAYEGRAVISLPKHHTSLAHLEHSMVRLTVTEGSVNESKWMCWRFVLSLLFASTARVPHAGDGWHWPWQTLALIKLHTLRGLCLAVSSLMKWFYMAQILPGWCFYFSTGWSALGRLHVSCCLSPAQFRAP